MPIKFAVKIVRLKVYIIFPQSDNLDLHSRSQLRLKLDKTHTLPLLWRNAERKKGKLDKLVTYTTIVASKLGMTVDLCMAYMFMFVSMTMTLMQGHSGSAGENVTR